MSNREIAVQLFMSVGAAKGHLRRIFAKLGVTSRVQLVRIPLDEVQAVSGPGARPLGS